MNRIPQLSKQSTRVLTIGFVLMSVLLLAGLAYWNYHNTQRKQTTPRTATSNLNSKAASQTQTNPGEVVNPAAGEIDYQTIVESAYVPWDIVFTNADRFLFTQRSGQVYQVVNDRLVDEPVLVIEEVEETGETGLLGMAVDPNYANNKYLYIGYLTRENGGLVGKVERFVDQGNQLEFEKTLVDDIPGARFHAGMQLGFGPDGYLYVSTGDALDRPLSQDLDSLAGKVLRYDRDGQPPTDNPFDQSPIYSLGHRNPQGFDWHPETNQMYLVEHGPSGFDGPGGGDEVNRIMSGENYGWPEVSHQESDPRFVDPLLVYTPAIAPSGASFYQGDLFPDWRNHLLVASLQERGLLVIRVEPDGTEQVEAVAKGYGRIRAVTVSPEGEIYFSTSNRDGRGSPESADDRIIKITRK